MIATNTGQRLQREDLPFKTLDGKTVVLQPATREVHVLNEVGTHIWALLQQPRSTDELGVLLRQEFTAPPNVLEDELTDFVQTMLRKQLLRPQPDAEARL